ncbi:MAG: ADP-ribosylation/crystallin J1 [Mesorhizobium sp.]|uniref:ADP-ribosylation/crystallin J1 n=1 Tax=Mesorhizobium sp. TaxID=1871066 RepID=UPI001226DD32|nr:ADP-ribosylation/crystallin J1 [Mesorhizobium sp.]TIO53466.1 MAG: ADP-ribosylation/crystallin J1 [Mesorhizobium sp.]TIO62371.1 MAG: ADP-ribosylation/crystallin J1 [Mesorhizobium sp.]TJV67089.1 MAG: ADP-ribosylation/crystallin J1 [Mesorhizobium sp.]
MDNDTVTLWRPVGPQELKLIEASGMREFPPRLPEQPIFYPVLSEAYAIQIARDWNVPASGSGFVTRFDVRKSFLDRYPVEHAGSRAHLEYWIPAEELPAFNKAIVGKIEVTATFGQTAEQAR